VIDARDSPTGYTIALAKPAHLEALAEIERAAARLFRAGDLPGTLADETTPVATLARDQCEGRLWVALAPSGRTVGFVQAAIVDNHPHLEELNVHPDHGKRGVGSQLLTAVVAWSRSHGRPVLTLTTFDHVPWNRPFYERRGFVKITPGANDPELLQILADESAKGLRHRVAMRNPAESA
jgi:GNAT superfamily N-acetyltransferase